MRTRIGVLAALLVLTTSGCAAVARLTGVDCVSDPTERQAEAVESEVILKEHPPGTKLVVPRYVSPACDDDNGVAEVGVAYAFTQSPWDVAAYYRSQAPTSGWALTRDGTRDLKLRPDANVSWPNTTCFSKRIGSITADLQLLFGYGGHDRRNWLEISFSPDGGNCAIED